MHRRWLQTVGSHLSTQWGQAASSRFGGAVSGGSQAHATASLMRSQISATSSRSFGTSWKKLGLSDAHGHDSDSREPSARKLSSNRKVESLWSAEFFPAGVATSGKMDLYDRQSALAHIEPLLDAAPVLTSTPQLIAGVLEDFNEVVQADSVKRKRRRKINQHKVRKHRKKYRMRNKKP